MPSPPPPTAEVAGGDTTRCSVERITSFDQRASISPALTATAPRTGGACAKWPVQGSRTCRRGAARRTGTGSSSGRRLCQGVRVCRVGLKTDACAKRFHLPSIRTVPSSQFCPGLQLENGGRPESLSSCLEQYIGLFSLHVWFEESANTCRPPCSS